MVLTPWLVLTASTQTTALRKLCCVNCGVEIASKSDVYTVPGAEGTTGAYVNPQGYVHQTVTLRSASNIMLMGSPEARDSWFPGFAWTIAYCSGCGNHMGWRFTPVPPRRRRSNSGSGGGSGSSSRGGEGTLPDPFFGIRRSELTDEPPAGAGEVD